MSTTAGEQLVHEVVDSSASAESNVYETIEPGNHNSYGCDHGNGVHRSRIKESEEQATTPPESIHDPLSQVRQHERNLSPASQTSPTTPPSPPQPQQSLTNGTQQPGDTMNTA